jgi:hypothetical protein
MRAKLKTDPMIGWKALVQPQPEAATQQLIDLIGTCLAAGKEAPILASILEDVMLGKQHIVDLDLLYQLRRFNADC